MAELSPNAAALLAWTRRLIAGRAAPPSDFQIAKRFGLRTPDDAMTLLNELRSAGLIEVERTSHGRNIYITVAAPIELPAPVSRKAADLVAAAMPLRPTEAVKLPARPAPSSSRPPLGAPSAEAPCLPSAPAPATAPAKVSPLIQEEPVMSDAVTAHPPVAPTPDPMPTPAQARTERLLEELTRCADAGLPCPVDRDLARLLGYGSDTSIYSPLHALRDRGDISIERVPGRGRIVTICATGRSTARVGQAALAQHAERRPTAPLRTAPPLRSTPSSLAPPRARSLHTPFSASVAIIDGAPALTVKLILDQSPAREFLSVPLDETHLLELLGTAAIALRDLHVAVP